MSNVRETHIKRPWYISYGCYFLSAVTLLCVGVIEYAFPAFKEVFKNFNAKLTGATSLVLKYHYLINLAIVILLPHFAYLVLLGMQKESSGLKMVYLFFVLFILFVLIVVAWFFFAIYSQYIPIYIMGTPI